jgi:transposase, IS30 family
MPKTHTKSYKQLQPEERISIASFCQQGLNNHQIAQRLHRCPSTISRELKRNRSAQTNEHTRVFAYSSQEAQHQCLIRRKASRKPPKLAKDSLLFDLVKDFLHQRWSPMQIARTLANCYPQPNHIHRVSHQTIYNCIYAMPVGALRKDLIACLRQAKPKRGVRSPSQDKRGHIPEMLSIHVRPPEIEDRQLPGHWEGDLIKGAGNASAIGTLVERTSRVLMLVKLPNERPASAANVCQAFTDKLLSIAQPMRQSLTYDQGREMAHHQQLTRNTGMAVYFCDPHSPWQRGSNENMNGLLRQYFPKGTDLSQYSQEQLDAVADQINHRPRAIFGFRSPFDVFNHLMATAHLQSDSIH